MDDTASQPTRPVLAVGVGVTGHRDLAWTDELRATVADVLQRVGQIAKRVGAANDSCYARGDPFRCIVTSLAPGADQIVSREALDHGFALHAILPFNRDLYVEEMDLESRGTFSNLLSEAQRLFELEAPAATAEDKSRAYEAAGKMVLSHSDLLLAIWDGDESRGRGGTADIVESAVQQRIPVVCVGSARPHQVSVLTLSRGRREQLELSELEAVLNAFLLPNSGGVAEFFQEKDPRERWHSSISKVYRKLWDVFMTSIAGRKNISSDSPDSQTGDFADCYHFVNTLAIYFAEMYRSSFLFNYSLGAVSVTLALLAYAVIDYARWFVLAELLVMVLIIANFAASRAGKWQAKATDYRLLSEELRQMLFLGPLGQVTPYPRPQPFHASDPNDTWMRWYFRALVRWTGIPTVRMSTDHLAARHAAIHETLVKTQLRYHEETARRYHLFETRLHRFAQLMFIVTALACLAHLLPLHLRAPFLSMIHSHDKWFTFLVAVLPAWGAAAHAVSSQSEARGLSERSKAMARAMRDFDATLSQTSSLSPLGVAGQAEGIARVMLDEVVDWRISYQLPETVPA